ncbi:MAG: hypothetical protein WAU38_13980, partial [Ignavibacteria bacterium]
KDLKQFGKSGKKPAADAKPDNEDIALVEAMKKEREKILSKKYGKSVSEENQQEEDLIKVTEINRPKQE